MAYQLGLDTGGTFTDAVIVDDELNVIASAKSLTTHSNLIDGLQGAVQGILSPEIVPDISLVSLSTTLATNALVEGRGRAVGLLLIGFNEKQLERAQLAQALGGDPHVFINGGHDASGKPVAELDLHACEAFIQQIDDRVDAYAVSGLFAVRNPEHELRVQALIEEKTKKPVTCGHHLTSGLDAPRRALTALLNARLIPMIQALLDASRTLLAGYDINAPLMVVKGDGSLINDSVATKYPVETILSGPAASVVGAQYLCKEPNLLISDMGGTTTDVALIENHQPKLNKEGATVGGWRTMVNAVDVYTFGLGGDSAVNYDRSSRKFQAGPNRVMPVSLLIHQYPELLHDLEAQWELPLSTTHSAQFVLLHGLKPLGLSSHQSDLYEVIESGPIAVQTLFKDQTLDRALIKLEQKGVVLRAGFTPSDACHVLNKQSDWNQDAAFIAAKLLMRYSADNLGKVYESETEFALSVLELISRETALLLTDSALAGSIGQSLSDSQLQLMRNGFDTTSHTLVSMNTRLNVPVVGLGAPARSYYPRSAELLSTKLYLPELGHVANALGAVVGSVRQQQVINIYPAGAKRVRVLLPSGPVEFETLEEGAHAAERVCKQLAVDKATNAGAESVTVQVSRKDNMVEDGNQQVFFESIITAVAVGRPVTA